MGDETFDAIRAALKRLERSTRKLVPATPPPEPDPIDVLIEAALWDLQEEAALKIVQYQRTRKTGPLLMIPPDEQDREILRALVGAVTGLRRELARTDDSVAARRGPEEN